MLVASVPPQNNILDYEFAHLGGVMDAALRMRCHRSHARAILITRAVENIEAEFPHLRRDPRTNQRGVHPQRFPQLTEDDERTYQQRTYNRVVYLRRWLYNFAKEQ
jgi:hypothetical protein